MAIKIRILEAPDTDTFDKLFHEHMERLKKYDLLPDEIEPDRLAEIHRAIDCMDRAWLDGNLQRFKEAMQIVESLYFEAVKVNQINQTEG